MRGTVVIGDAVRLELDEEVSLDLDEEEFEPGVVAAQFMEEHQLLNQLPSQALRLVFWGRSMPISKRMYVAWILLLVDSTVNAPLAFGNRVSPMLAQDSWGVTFVFRRENPQRLISVRFVSHDFILVRHRLMTELQSMATGI